MNDAAVSPARALVRANPRRLSASRARAVARLRLLSAAAALTDVTTRDFLVVLFSLSERALSDRLPRTRRCASLARPYVALRPHVVREESTRSPGQDLPRRSA